jgi:hypothetical protein
MFDIFYSAQVTLPPRFGRPAVDITEAQNLSRTRFFWWITGNVDLDHWDWTWEPPPWQSHQQHAWRDQFGNDSGLSLRSNITGTEINWHQETTLLRIADPGCWFVPDWIDAGSIDPTWVPNSGDPPYIYEFPVEWSWDRVGGPQYRVPGAVQHKYVTDFVARTRADPLNFQVYDALNQQDDVFRWRPNPCDPPYVYVFGNQWWSAEKRVSAEYHVPGATERKYMAEPRAQRLPVSDNYHALITTAEFDQSWEPDPGDPPYIYVFGNQWWPPEIMPTVEYHVPGATERKFLSEPRARLTDTHEDHWLQLVSCNWDQTWQPDPGDPPYIYVFGNQWWPPEIMPTVEYHVPGAVTRKFLQEPRAQLPQDPTAWSVPEEVDARAIDYSWCPDPGSPPYVYHFGSEHQESVGVTYTVPGASELKFAGDIPLLQSQPSAMLDTDCFYIDFSNALSAARFAALQQRVPGVQRVRFVNSLLDTLRRCSRRATTPRFWALSSQNDYRDFDLSWHPAAWQRGMIHVFGTQWNKWSDTFLINRWEFDRQSSWQTRMQDFYNLNFVEHQLVEAATDASDIIVIDHGNAELDQVVEDLQQRSGRIVRVARYFDSYQETFARLLADLDCEHVWVVSSVCDYREFDFSWQPEAWQKDMLHVFASDEQRFGDTFYVPVQKLRAALPDLALLEWFETVNYCADQKAPRWPMPLIQHNQDSHVSSIRDTAWTAPLMLFATRDVAVPLPTVSLWNSRSRTIVPLDTGASAVIVPRDAAGVIQTQCYDYAYIDTSHRDVLDPQPQDVVFISYDEPEADQNWATLQALCPRARRLHGVEGMETALEAAADLSATPWYFAVFAKTSLEPSFDFSYQPDRMQQPKHYIFNCRNPLNGLEYGHMAVVLYNCAGIRETNRSGSWGVDYTMSWPTESIPILSCHGNFNTTAYHTWRTAFRETAKLAWFESQQHTIDGQYRLRTWLNRAAGQHSEWCLQGARDAQEFFEASGGDLTVIKQSFRWQWLREYFVQRHGELD